jgi:tetratricopeptide (TPR) repeat protein
MPTQMDASHYVTCLWPGLPELWFRGRWSGLPAALLFAASLNFLLVARWIYPEWLIPSLVRIACWVAVGVWVMCVIRQLGRLPSLLEPRLSSDAGDLFPVARNLYLQGDLVEAEANLAQCLEIDARDCQALLLLSAIYRQTGRFQAAKQTNQLLSKLETADNWWLECQTEREKLQRAEVAQADADTQADTDSHAEGEEPAENSPEIAQNQS